MGLLRKIFPIFLTGCALSQLSSPSTELINSHECVFDDGTSVHVDLFRLSDASLDFARLRFHETSFVLPRLRAASGVRYSDDVVVYWNKGMTSLFRGENDKASRECKIK